MHHGYQPLNLADALSSVGTMHKPGRNDDASTTWLLRLCSSMDPALFVSAESNDDVVFVVVTLLREEPPVAD